MPAAHRLLLIAVVALPWLWPFTSGPTAGTQPYLVSMALAAVLLALWPARQGARQAVHWVADGWLLAAGFTWAIAILHARRHRWRMSPLDVLPWQMGLATVLLWILAILIEPQGYLDLGQPSLWLSLLYLGVLAGPTATWAAVSVARALPPITGSLGMLGVPLLAIASSILLVGEPVTWPLAAGTALVIAGIAIVILDRNN